MPNIRKGINDLATTHPEYIKYLVNPNDAYLIGIGSHKIVLCKCPTCGDETFKRITNVRKNGYCCKICSDKFSYPNKFIRALFDELGVDAEYEYSPKWLKPYRFDSFFVLNNKSFVVEMDGNVGHGNNKFNSTERDIKGIATDHLKDSLASKQGIKVIRIDAKKSEVNYIKNSIEHSELSEIFDLSIVDWNKCGVFAESNLLKEVCEYYSSCTENEKSIQNIQSKFHIARDTVRIYLVKGTKLGLCNYDKELSERLRKKNALAGVKNAMKKIYVYDKEMNLLYEFKNIHECVDTMSKTYGTTFLMESVRTVCRGTRKSLNNFIFKYERLGD